MATRFYTWATLVFVILQSYTLEQRLLANVGGEDTNRYYSNKDRGRDNGDAVEQDFTIELDAVTFPLTTWEGKYRIVRVKIANRGKTPLVLSSTKDTVVATVPGKSPADSKSVSAQLIPSSSVPEIWDKLDQFVRERLAYPKSLPAGETKCVYLFFPAKELTDLPLGVSWHISSLNKTVLIQPPEPTKD